MRVSKAAVELYKMRTQILYLQDQMLNLRQQILGKGIRYSYVEITTQIEELVYRLELIKLEIKILQWGPHPEPTDSEAKLVSKWVELVGADENRLNYGIFSIFSGLSNPSINKFVLKMKETVDEVLLDTKDFWRVIDGRQAQKESRIHECTLNFWEEKYGNLY